MTILIYDNRELDERASKHLRPWKVWHIILYILATIFGILNYTFLFETERLVDKHCVFYPRMLEFHWVEKPYEDNQTTTTENPKILFTEEIDNTSEEKLTKNVIKEEKVTEIAQTTTTPVPGDDAKVVKREAHDDFVTTEVKSTVEEKNWTAATENTTHRFVLHTARTLFPSPTDTGCQFAEYMPLLSAAFAIIWMTLFIMCPTGGRIQGSGLQEPWRILTPAFVFAFVMVILTGYSFTSTNGGLQAFCAAFHNNTNSTTCSPVNRFIEMPVNTTWTLSGRIAATRAASAGVWASWACACALLLARCLAGADFVVRHTAVRLVRDPQQKLMPLLKKQNSPRRSARSIQNSPSKRDTVSVRSDPTLTSELVTASVEHEGREMDSQPTSLAMTPLKRGHEELDSDSAQETAFRE
ncbi:hypothetical protein O0L34_g779 [Tuta absoluta]|nr:hypothetical protein O0L34_g3399 [Tuta absoluta]KAJ2953202.1 hypothetical protein O0L34_g779 [Tuta absoluta]